MALYLQPCNQAPFPQDAAVTELHPVSRAQRPPLIMLSKENRLLPRAVRVPQSDSMKLLGSF